VPGLVSPGEKCYCCARCGSVLQVEKFEDAEQIDFQEVSPRDAGQHAAIRYDPWELNERLRHIQRVLHNPARQARPGSSLRWEVPPTTAPAADEAPQPANWVAIVSWPLIALGFAVFACGAALLGLSLGSGRGDLWRLGLPTLLAGQFALLVALVLQLASRYASHKAIKRQVREADAQWEAIRRRLTESGAIGQRAAQLLEE